MVFDEDELKDTLNVAWVYLFLLTSLGAMLAVIAGDNDTGKKMFVASAVIAIAAVVTRVLSAAENIEGVDKDDRVGGSDDEYLDPYGMTPPKEVKK